MVTQPTEDYPRIYTAGAMRWENAEDSEWRRSVEDSLSDITFYHPHNSYFDHGGDTVQGAVSEDIQAIDAADGVVAYYSETPQIGTTVETLHALHTNTPTLALFDEGLLGQSALKSSPDEDAEFPQELGSAVFRGTADDHWFLLNYISGESDTSGQRSIPDWISNWDGFSRGTVKAVESTEEIRSAVEEWITGEFGEIE